MAQFATREAEIAVAAAAEQATTTKDEALEGFTHAMKADFRYAENTVDFDDDKLKVLGWGGRKAGTSSRPWSIAGTQGANRVRRISEATEATEAPREGEGRTGQLGRAACRVERTGLPCA